VTRFVASVFSSRVISVETWANSARWKESVCPAPFLRDIVLTPYRSRWKKRAKRPRFHSAATHNTASASDQRFLRRREAVGRITGRKIAPLEELTRRQYEIATYECFGKNNEFGSLLGCVGGEVGEFLKGLLRVERAGSGLNDGRTHDAGGAVKNDFC
jgi:hypothetical protein